jgi:hypothetical protein
VNFTDGNMNLSISYACGSETFLAHESPLLINPVPDDNALTDAINQTEDWVRERIFQFNNLTAFFWAT